MMEIFGLINHSRLPLGSSYLPGYSSLMTPGMAAYPGLGGLGMMPGASPWAGYPGMGMMPGAGLPGVGRFPGAGVPGGFAPFPGTPGGGGYRNLPGRGALDGAWELANGSFVIIKGDTARLYLSEERHQDFVIKYDDKAFWWSPRDSNTAKRYRYQVSNGRMLLRDNDGKVLLLLRRR